MRARTDKSSLRAGSRGSCLEQEAVPPRLAGWLASSWGYLVVLLFVDLPLGALQLLHQGVLGEKSCEPGTLPGSPGRPAPPLSILAAGQCSLVPSRD